MSIEPAPFDPDAEDELPEAPRAPAQAAWDAMSEAERRAAVEALPDDIPWEEIGMPEGDVHYDAKNDTRDVLKGIFSRAGRSAYVAADLAVYYPDEARFSPDVLVVLDVGPHDRMKWVVSAEGKGLDLALEVVVAGKRRKDTVANRARYARLGIPEYFVFDHRRGTVRGWRLPAGGPRVYDPIEPRGGLVPSETLGLEFGVVGKRLRLFFNRQELHPSSELLRLLEARLDELDGAVEHERRVADDERARADEERARADAAEARAKELEAELARLRGGG